MARVNIDNYFSKFAIKHLDSCSLVFGVLTSDS